MKQFKVEGIFTQPIQTMHPDFEIGVRFEYKATVFEDETVDIHDVKCVDGLAKYNLRLTPKSEHESEMSIFLDIIRERAREIVYEKHKAAKLEAYNRIVRAIKI